MKRFVKPTLGLLAALAVGISVSWGMQSVTPVIIHSTSSTQARIGRQALPEIETFSSKQFDVALTGRVPEPEVAPCDIGQEVLKPDTATAAVQLDVGTKEYHYTEKRGESIVKFHDPEKQIALRILDLATCTRETVVITKKGNELIAPQDWDIEAVTRANGIQWNDWATQYKINKPTGKVVLFNDYPHVQGSGKSRSIIRIHYVAYNEDLRVPLLINVGRGYMEDLASRALDELRRLEVPSLAVPGTLLADTPVAQTAWLAHLGPTEHMDYGEFVLDQEWSFQQVLVRIGGNQKSFAALTCNASKACGLMQFTDNGVWENKVFKPGAYEHLRKAYPQAKLVTSFTEGSKDPLNSMKAAFLHHDDVYKTLLDKLGSEVPTNPIILEELVGAGYNAGAGRVVDAYKAMLKKKSTDWISALPICKRKKQPNCIPSETIGYVQKIRFIREAWDDPLLSLNSYASD